MLVLCSADVEYVASLSSLKSALASSSRYTAAEVLMATMTSSSLFFSGSVDKGKPRGVQMYSRSTLHTRSSDPTIVYAPLWGSTFLGTNYRSASTPKRGHRFPYSFYSTIVRSRGCSSQLSVGWHQSPANPQIPAITPAFVSPISTALTVSPHPRTACS